jgi:hypothetical protein
MTSKAAQLKDMLGRRLSGNGEARRDSKTKPTGNGGVAEVVDWGLDGYSPMPCATAEMQWDAFISHRQANGGAQCHTLFQHLTHAQAVKVWYDNDAERLNEVGMEEGVRLSTYFFLFVTDGIFERPWYVLH